MNSEILRTDCTWVTAMLFYVVVFFFKGRQLEILFASWNVAAFHGLFLHSFSHKGEHSSFYQLIVEQYPLEKNVSVTLKYQYWL